MNSMERAALRVEYITRDYLKRLHGNKLIQLLVSRLLDNSIIIMEGVLNPLTQSELLMRILNYINMQFFGIDIKTIKKFSRKEITIIYPKKKDLDLDIQATFDYLSLVVRA